jgi:hypothetical protein
VKKNPTRLPSEQAIATKENTHCIHGGVRHKFEFEQIAKKDGKVTIKHEYLYVKADGTALTSMDFFGDSPKPPEEHLKFHCWCYSPTLGKFTDLGIQ